MLYLIYRHNHPDLEYRGGQEDIVHLVVDLRTIVAWAEANRLHWAFTNTNAGSRLFESYSDLRFLDTLRWDHLQATNWTDVACKENKQAEFLLERTCPLSLIETIGVVNENVASRALNLLQTTPHPPCIEVRPEW